MKVTDRLGQSHIIAQSLAIIEFIDSIVPTGPKLIPIDPFLRARVYEIALTIVADNHPLVVYITNSKETPAESEIQPTIDVILKGLTTVETLLSREEKSEWKYSVGNELTLADIVLEPHVRVAKRFNINLDNFPKIVSIHEHISQLPAFVLASPENQPDAPKK